MAIIRTRGNRLERFLMGPADFLADNLDASADNSFVHREGHAQALMLVTPGWIVMTEEEVVAGDDQHATGQLPPYVRFCVTVTLSYSFPDFNLTALSNFGKSSA